MAESDVKVHILYWRAGTPVLDNLTRESVSATEEAVVDALASIERGEGALMWVHVYAPTAGAGETVNTCLAESQIFHWKHRIGSDLEGFARRLNHQSPRLGGG